MDTHSNCSYHKRAFVSEADKATALECAEERSYSSRKCREVVQEQRDTEGSPGLLPYSYGEKTTERPNASLVCRPPQYTDRYYSLLLETLDPA